MGGQIWEGDNYGKRCGLEAGDIVVLNGNHWPKGDWRVWDSKIG
jgi:hypothetical protein